MGGAVPQQPLYAFVARRGTALLSSTTTIEITAAFHYSNDICLLPSADQNCCFQWCGVYRYGRFGRNVLRQFLCTTFLAAGTRLLSHGALHFTLRLLWYKSCVPHI